MKDRVQDLLKSQKPSERSLAIDLLHESPTEVDLATIRACVQSEPVPSLRGRLEILLRNYEELQPARGGIARQSGHGVAHESGSENSDDGLVHWMRHELEPAIGWLRLAANKEIVDFAGSETCAAIENLRARMDSIEALGRVSAPLKLELTPLGELIEECIRTNSMSDRAHLDLSNTGDGDIKTDPRLFRIMISNAIRNAFEALLELDDRGVSVQISAGTTGTHFWINISNRFAGAEFRMDEVSGTGVSGKIDHQGQGFSIMRKCAVRLGYDLALSADGGMATLTVRGSRFA